MEIIAFPGNNLLSGVQGGIIVAFWSALQGRLRSRWRRLPARVRRWTIALVTACLATIGAAISAAFTDKTKDALQYVIRIGEDLACNVQGPARTPTKNLPVVLFARLADDKNDEMRRRLMNIYIDETDFDVIPSCKRFEISDRESIASTRARFLERIDPHVKAAKADMLLFGSVYAAGKIRVWSANSLGGCDWQSNAYDLDGSPPSAAVSSTTRSLLLRIVVQGLVAACERPQDSDWSVVEQKVDMASAFLEKKRTSFSLADHEEAQIYLHALSISRYSTTGEEKWFDRSQRAVKAVIASATTAGDSFTVDKYKVQLAFIDLLKFNRSGSLQNLTASIRLFRQVRQADQRGWVFFRGYHADEHIEALEAGLARGVGDVTPLEVQEAKAELKGDGSRR